MSTMLTIHASTRIYTHPHAPARPGLSDNALGAGAGHVAAVLQVSDCNITALNLRGNGLGQGEAAMLCAAVRTNTKLTR